MDRGFVLMSWPGRHTRPGIANERKALIGVAAEHGLVLVRHERQAVAYEAPLFERNALRSAGLGCVSRYWRRGDLFVFQRVGSGGGARPQLEYDIDEWDEVRGPGCRLRLRRREVAVSRPSGLPQVLSLVPGDVLPTVSRRDPRRTRVDVWTSGNRVFECADTPGLMTLVGIVVATGSQEAAADAVCTSGLFAAGRPEVEELVAWVHALLAVEEGEYHADPS